MNKEKLIPELRFPEFENEGEWDLKEFSNFIKLDRGSSPRPIQEYLTQDVSGVNWIKIGDTKNAVNSVIYQVEEKITSKGAEKSRRVEIGELILANSMSFGKTYELAIEGCIYDGWFVLRKYDKYFVKPFLLQLLNSDFMQNQYKRLSAGGIVQNISSDIVYNSKLFHTSLLEQQKIASCLSSLDEVIAAHSQKLDLLKEHKKGMMQNLFPDEGEKVQKYRFKEFEKDGEWEEEVLGEICDVRDGTHDSPKYVSMGYPMITSKNLLINGIIDFDNVSYLSEDDYNQINKRSKVEIDDILFGMIGTIGNPVIVKNDGFSIKNVALIKSNGKLNQEFLLHQLKSNYILTQFDKVNAGGILKFIALGVIRNLTVIVPSPKEQQKIASCLSSLDILINAQEEKIEQLRLHKKGLMQGLFPKIQD
jgi:type I restriction enzyme S subunit